MKAIGSKKRCSHCRKLLRLVAFNKNAWAIDGFQHLCRRCQQQRHRKWYAKHKDRRHAYYLAHRDKMLAWHRRYHIAHRARRRAYAKMYYRTHRAERRAYEKRHRLRDLATLRTRLKALRRRVLGHYSHGTMRCTCCRDGHLEFLAIDHIHGRGHEHRKRVGSGATFYQWLVRQGFPHGYRVLCHNCNMSRGYYGYCPHESETRFGQGHQINLIRRRRRR